MAFDFLCFQGWRSGSIYCQNFLFLSVPSNLSSSRFCHAKTQTTASNPCPRGRYCCFTSITGTLCGQNQKQILQLNCLWKCHNQLPFSITNPTSQLRRTSIRTRLRQQQPHRFILKPWQILRPKDLVRILYDPSY